MPSPYGYGSNNQSPDTYGLGATARPQGLDLAAINQPARQSTSTWTDSQIADWKATQMKELGGFPETGKDASSNTGAGWMENAQAWGQLGLGLASFLEDRKTAKLQREAMKLNLGLAKEHQANRQALNQSWNEGWSQA